jgi:hypothetical protein
MGTPLLILRQVFDKHLEDRPRAIQIQTQPDYLAVSFVKAEANAARTIHRQGSSPLGFLIRPRQITPDLHLKMIDLNINSLGRDWLVFVRGHGAYC